MNDCIDKYLKIEYNEFTYYVNSYSSPVSFHDHFMTIDHYSMEGDLTIDLGSVFIKNQVQDDYEKFLNDKREILSIKHQSSKLKLV